LRTTALPEIAQPNKKRAKNKARQASWRASNFGGR
jgi:hypothetical protein